MTLVLGLGATTPVLAYAAWRELAAPSEQRVPLATDDVAGASRRAEVRSAP